jgi:isochorismate synthase
MNIQDSYSALSMLQSVCRKQKIPFVSYRLPLQTEIITLVQHHSFPDKLENLNDLHHRTGFVIAPFTETNSHVTYFLEPDCVFFDNNIDSVYIDKLAANNRFIDVPDNKNSLQTTSREEFTGNVATAVSAMKSREFQKVVLSKVRVESLPENFSAEDFFLKLCSKYPHAFVYLLQVPGVGCWTGATPEPLLTPVSYTHLTLPTN